MYTPENHQQMFEIITALRTYAGTNAMPATAELLDDALMILADEGRDMLANPERPECASRAPEPSRS